MGLLLSASAAAIGIGTLLVGALIAWRWDLPKRAVGAVMAFGSGVLIATLALELVADASDGGVVWPVVVGFAAGAVLYVAGDQGVSRLTSRRRRHSTGESGSRNVTARRGGDTPGDEAAIAVGALLDGIPEAIVIGLSAASGFPVGIVAAIALSNVPEGLAGTVPLKRSGRSLRFVLLLWGGITVLAVAASLVGAALMADASPEALAVVLSLAAGALLAMVSNAMIPEAFDDDRQFTGLIATLGFLVAFVLQELA